MDGIFSETEHKRIADAIREAENRTTGEIVCVVARQCEPYAIIAMMWSALGGLLAGAVAVPFWSGLPVFCLPLLQVAVVALLMLLLQITPLRMAMVPEAVKRRRAERLARAQFLEQGLHRTEGRTGILIFAAMAEHHVEILADEGIDAKVDPATWQTVVDGFTAQMKRGETIDAFVDAIGQCGAPLAEHFPKTPGNANELPDRLVEI
ncbi:MAG: TPM domain-containing protein [Minwuia sp.]|uniref:TPM domain-containing protein n=1 Tax=Minwuia sp. TaxID=2493630 RepID=UPI003A8ABA19